MGDVCALAGVAHSTWSRAKKRGWLRPRKLKQIEETLDWLEEQRRQSEQPAAQVSA